MYIHIHRKPMFIGYRIHFLPSALAIPTETKDQRQLAMAGLPDLGQWIGPGKYASLKWKNPL